MELTAEVKALLLNTAKDLKGCARRMFMARTVQALSEGGKLLAERELGWNQGRYFSRRENNTSREAVPTF